MPTVIFSAASAPLTAMLASATRFPILILAELFTRRSPHSLADRFL
jgi:hypothetical protein